jgi:hypothetical protein
MRRGCSRSAATGAGCERDAQPASELASIAGAGRAGSQHRRSRGGRTGVGDRAQRAPGSPRRARGHPERRARRTRPQGAQRPEPRAGPPDRSYPIAADTSSGGTRDADPPPRHQAQRLPWFARRLRRSRQPDGRKGVPTGLTRRAPTWTLVAQPRLVGASAERPRRRRGGFTGAAPSARATAPRRPPPVGLLATALERANRERKEEAAAMTVAARRGWRGGCR